MNVREITITPRQYGEDTTLETKTDANETVDRQQRYKQILRCFEMEKQLTAKECAEMMCFFGYTPTSERNFTAPRITELCQRGILEPVGKKVCKYTGKTVAVYARRAEA